MIRIFRFLPGLFLAAVSFFWQTSALQAAGYAVWLYAENNDTQEFLDIEEQYSIELPVVGYIFDEYGEPEDETFRRAVELLWTGKVYHVSLSPYGYSAEEVAEGAYDEQYRRFFQTVKETGAKVVFRTMHEMNGSWFSWSGDPESFRRAWIHVHGISREEGLDASNLLFIMSMNSQDLPSEDGVVNGKMIFCSPERKKKTGCVSFEDYYPGNRYVDILGMTLYNWGRGRSEEWAVWRSFPDLLNDPKTRMFERIKSYGKPVFLDEVGTTAVDFEGPWSAERARESYIHDTERKNEWILKMRSELARNPEIVGVLYFNRDKTDGLTDRSQIGELDWSVISLRLGKQYRTFLRFFKDPGMNAKRIPFAKDQVALSGKRYATLLIRKTLKAHRNNPKAQEAALRTHLEKAEAKVESSEDDRVIRYWEAVSVSIRERLAR